MSDEAIGPTLAVSELFESIQGEGPSSGIPALFLRLAGCNLRCTWCDTPYSWDFERFERAREVTSRSVRAIAAEVACSTHRLLVLTGGEPLLQQENLGALLPALPSALRIEVETNGTQVPSESLTQRIDQWNVSPKLDNSLEPMERRWNSKALRVLRDTERAWLKFVVRQPRDLEQADACFRMWGWRRDRVILMPCARTREELTTLGAWVADACVQRDWRYSSRLHVAIWGTERGR